MKEPTDRGMDTAAQKEWLVTHLPHRVRAAMARLPFQDELLKSISAAEAPEIRVRCDGNAIWEGRLAAVRWLIEFIGVKEDRSGKPARPKPRGADSSIVQLAGGRLFDLMAPEAVFLARLWKGCSQAGSHATHASGHPPVNEAQLDHAMRIVTAHLDATIYASHSRKVAAASLHMEKQ